LSQQMQAHVEAEKDKVEVTLMVSECSEFHNMGEFYENIPTVEEAIAIWKQIPPNVIKLIYIRRANNNRQLVFLLLNTTNRQIFICLLMCYKYLCRVMVCILSL